MTYVLHGCILKLRETLQKLDTILPTMGAKLMLGKNENFIMTTYPHLLQ